MSEIIKEQISACLDDELSGEELELLFRRLETESESKALFQRYQLYRDVIGTGKVLCHYPDLADCVLGRVEAEEADQVAGRQHTLVSRNLSRFKPLAGFAVAASVAAFTLGIALRGSWVGNTDLPSAASSIAVMPSSELIPRQSTVPVSDFRMVSLSEATSSRQRSVPNEDDLSGLSEVSAVEMDSTTPAAGGNPGASGTMEWERLSPEVRARLSGYIVNHASHSSVGNAVGVDTGLVRMAGQSVQEPAHR
jgi:hypothetical protein